MSVDRRVKDSEWLFFRIKDKNSLSINDRKFYFDSLARSVDQEEGITVEIYIFHDKKEVLMLLEGDKVDKIISLEEYKVSFYHSKVKLPPKNMILYNLNSTSSCHFKRIQLCDQVPIGLDLTRSRRKIE